MIGQFFRSNVTHKKSISNVTFFVHFSSKFWAETAACVKLITRKIELSCMSTVQKSRVGVKSMQIIQTFK